MIISHHPDQIKIWFSFLFFRSKEVEAFPPRPPVQFWAFKCETWIKPANLDVTELTESSISASEVKPMWSEPDEVKRAASLSLGKASIGARCNVLCFTARGVCLVFRSHLCLISPAVKHQPPPTCDGHTTCHPHMAWGEGSTCGISPVTRIQIKNQWMVVHESCHVLAWRGVESVTAWHIICDVVSALVTRVWRKQDRSDHLICCI